MVLNELQAKETILTPRSKQLIESVKFQESQLRVVTQEMSEEELTEEPYWGDLMSRLNARSKNKFSKIKSYFRYPLPVVQLTDSILNDYNKVFDGKNRAFSISADRNVETLDSWIDQTEPDKWIEEQAKQVFKGKPMSFIVVDVDGKGIPYAIMIDSDRLVDVLFKDKKGNLEYISFVHSQNIIEGTDGEIRTYYSVYDDENYHVLYKDSNDDKIVLESTTPHNVGYCPARSFISESSSDKNIIKRPTVFSKAAANLEDWVVFDVFRNYVDHYAPFPITESPATQCPNSMCQDGVVPEEYPDSSRPGEFKIVYSSCEICEKNKFEPYPGTNIEVAVSQDPNRKDVNGIFRMIMPDVGSLEYVPKKLKDLELEIRYKTVGVNQLLSKEAVNKDQVKGSFSSMETILVTAKKELDEAYRFYVKTAGRLLYKDLSVMVEANFGTEFYLLSEEQLQERFKVAKEIGLPAEEQLSIYKELVETKYKGNGVKLRRILMLLDLDPYPMLSNEECIKLKNESIIGSFDLALKVNFLKLIAKFESVNTDITAFGIELDYHRRIEIIEDELKRYNEEIIAEKIDRENPKKEGDEDGETPATQEELEGQAMLRSRVGGIQGILEIKASVASKISTKESAVKMIMKFYGLSRIESEAILGETVVGLVVDNPPSPDNTEGIELV